MVEELSPQELARSFAQTARDAFRDQGELFWTLPEDDWAGPTGCSEWTMHVLAGHSAGEAVWFARLARTVVARLPMLPDATWEQLKQLPGAALGDVLVGAGEGLVDVINRASPGDMEQPVDMGWAKQPLWRAMYVAMSEAVYHNWDGRARREPEPRIPVEWAQQLAGMISTNYTGSARREAAGKSPGTYLLRVGDGVGPVTIVVADGKTSIERGEQSNPDLTLHLTADQCMRLLVGRLPLGEAIDAGTVKLEGDRSRAEALNLIFAGIAN